jgi:aspartyl-tRNA(Asn)/glutamyl-tRNA(Gln) amidotransferase subunit C
MSLTSDDIARIANLARLELHPEESERMLTQINGFFGIVEAMRAVDTTGVEPLAHPVAVMQDVALRLRDDVVSEPNEREANQRSAPAVERGLFLVPKVIE